MKRGERLGWRRLIGDVGNSFLELLEAELDALKREVARSGRELGIGVGLMAAAAAVGFWTLGILTAAAVVLLALILPTWGAILVVSGIFLLLTAVLGGLGYRRIKRFEPPGRIAVRRWDDHRDWWRHTVLPGEAEPLLDEGEKTEESPK